MSRTYLPRQFHPKRIQINYSPQLPERPFGFLTAGFLLAPCGV
jgi:hypothetical protein